MTKKQLIRWSAYRDALNFLGIGIVPGLSQALDLPIIIMHFNYAGPAAVFTLLELIPLVGLFPFFTVSAMLYPDRDPSSNTLASKRDTAGSRLPASAGKRPLYALVDGELVSVIPPADDAQHSTPSDETPNLRRQ